MSSSYVRFVQWLRGCLVLSCSVMFACGAPSAAFGQALMSSSVVQDFSTLASSGTGSTLPPGWGFVESGASANATYTASTGSSNTGNTYSFGAAGSSERSLGAIRSGSLTSTIGAAFVNDTGGTVTSLHVTYWGEQWRLGATGRQDRLDFQYSLDAASLTSGTWTDVNELDFSSPVVTGSVGATNGDDVSHRLLREYSFRVPNVPPGGLLWIRWLDFDAAGADDGLAVDDFSLSASTSDVPPVVLTSSPATGTLEVPPSSVLSVTFSEAVTLAGGWSEIECEKSGAHAVAAGGGPMVYSAEIAGILEPGESCVWKIHAAAVADWDVPIDVMEEDVIIEFGTAGASGCGAPATSIHVVQGPGASSPLSGKAVVLEGVVVGNYQGASDLGGFFLQEHDHRADGNPRTSEGIFVHDGAGATALNVGDVVRVSGQVIEYFDLTEVTNVTEILVCGSGASVTPAALSLPLEDVNDLEAYEGMAVVFSQPLVASDTYNLGRYGELLLTAPERSMQPTQVAAPGLDALAVQDMNRRSTIQLDDGSQTQNPAFPPYLAGDGTVRVGDSVDGLQGVLGYSFGAFEVHPIAPVAFTRTNPRPAPPPPPGAHLRIAAFNVLNYFTTLDSGAAICGPSNDLGCRGANTSAEFARQRQKTLAAITAVEADIVGLVEVENNDSASVADLVAGLNGTLGPETYAYVDTGTIGTDAIKVALLYKPARVSLVGNYAILDSSVDAAFIDTSNRPVLAQSFRFTPTGEVLTVAVNHLKSKGSACPGDPDTGDLQGNCNGTRLAAAVAEAAWMASDPTAVDDPDILLIGDFNAYAKEDPISALESAGYVDLIGLLTGERTYSYVFEGQSGYLDHALASGTLVAKIERAYAWHINADEPRILDYNQEFNPPHLYQSNAYRASDHDPVIVDVRTHVAVPVPVSPVATGPLAAAMLLLGALLLLGSRRPATRPGP